MSQEPAETQHHRCHPQPQRHEPSGLASLLQTRALRYSVDHDREQLDISGIPAPDLLGPLLHRLSVAWTSDQFRERTHMVSAHALLKDHPLWLVGIDGPVECRDIEAFAHAFQLGQNLLECDIRSQIAITQEAHHVHVSTRDTSISAAITAAFLQRHAADALGCPIQFVRAPEPDVAALLLRQGGLLLRTVETECWPSFLDIGIANPSHEASPATRSVIFDRITGMWHTD